MDSKYKKYKCVKGAAKRTRMKKKEEKKKKSNEGAPKRKKQKAKWEQKI